MITRRTLVLTGTAGLPAFTASRLVFAAPPPGEPRDARRILEELAGTEIR